MRPEAQTFTYGEGDRAEEISGLEYERLVSSDMPGCSAYRHRTDGEPPRGFFITIVGPPERLPKMIGRVKQGRKIPEPEPGWHDAMIERHLQQIQMALFDRPPDNRVRRHYEHGAEVRRGGGIVEREEG